MDFDIQLEEAKLWDRLIVGLRKSSKWQFLIKVILILGGTLISVIGGSMEGPLSPKPIVGSPGTEVGILTLKGAMVILGAASAGLGGLLLLFVEWDTPELLDKARSYVKQIRVYLDERDALLRLDDKRRALLEMQTDIYEGCESMDKAQPIENVVRTILQLGSVNLPAAIGFDNRERWAFSVFRRVGEGEAEVMQRIAVHWADRDGEQREGRSWKKQQGFTGWAWHDNAEVIVQDVNAVEEGGKFHAAPGMAHQDDNQRYVSAAAIPIKVGTNDELWGVVTATSNVAGRFKRNPHDVRSQNVETVRVLARLIATQVALRNHG